MVLVAVAAYIAATPRDLTPYAGWVEEQILEKTTHKVSLEGVSLRLIPTEVKFTGVEVHHHGYVILGAESISIRPKLHTLLLETFIIEKVRITGAELGVERTEEGKFNVVGYVEEHPPVRPVLVKELWIENSTVTFHDMVPAEEPSYKLADFSAALRMNGERLDYRLEGNVEAARVAVSGELDTGDKTGSGTVETKDLPVNKINPYLAELRRRVAVDAVVDVEADFSYGERNTLDGTVAYRDLSLELPWYDSPLGSQRGESKVELAFGGGPSLVRLKAAELILDGFSINGFFSLVSGDNERVLDISLSTSRIPLVRLPGLIPTRLPGERAAGEIKNVKPLEGELTVEEFSLKGDIREITSKLFEDPDILSARISLEGAGFNYAPTGDTFTDVTGPVEVSKGRLQTSSLSFDFDHGSLEVEEASVGLGGERSFNASVSGRVDTGGVLDTATRFLESRKMAVPEALDKTKAAGPASVDLDVRETASGTDYSGRLDFQETALSYEDFPLRLEGLTGGLAFTTDSLAFGSLSGEATGTSFTLDGTLQRYRTDNPAFDIDLKAELVQSTLLPFIKDTPAEGLFFTGLIDTSLKTKGTTRSFQAGAAVDLTDAELRYRRFVEKARGFPARFNGAVAVDKDVVKVESADLEFGSSSAGLTGEFSRDLSSYSFMMSSTGIKISDLDDVSRLLKTDFDSRGLVTFRVVGEREGGRKPVYHGDASLAGGAFDTTVIAKPLVDVEATAEFTGNSAAVELTRGRAGDTSVTGSVTVLDIAEKRLVFDFLFPHLVVEDIYPSRKDQPEPGEEEKEAKEEKPPKEPGAPYTGSGIIIAKEGSAWGHPFTNLVMDFDLDPDAVTAKTQVLDIDEGTISSTVNVYRDPASELLYRASFDLQNVDLGVFFENLGVEKKILTGSLYGEFNLKGTRGAEPFTSGINGTAHLVSEKGKLWEFLFFNKIFSVVNIVSIDELFKKGLPYKEISGDYEFTDGVISTQNMLLDSDSIRMSAVGEIDMPNKSLDSILALHPFVTIDKVISQIPLAGWIITGREKSTVSMYFEIKGPFKDIKTTPKPVKTIERGVLGVFQRVLELPVEMFRPREEDETQPPAGGE